jgi:hypothetical protein
MKKIYRGYTIKKISNEGLDNTLGGVDSNDLDAHQYSVYLIGEYPDDDDEAIDITYSLAQAKLFVDYRIKENLYKIQFKQDFLSSMGWVDFNQDYPEDSDIFDDGFEVKPILFKTPEEALKHIKKNKLSQGEGLSVRIVEYRNDQK